MSDYTRNDIIRLPEGQERELALLGLTKDQVKKCLESGLPASTIVAMAQAMLVDRSKTLDIMQLAE